MSFGVLGTVAVRDGQGHPVLVVAPRAAASCGVVVRRGGSSPLDPDRRHVGRSHPRECGQDAAEPRRRGSATTWPGFRELPTRDRRPSLSDRVGRGRPRRVSFERLVRTGSAMAESDPSTALATLEEALALFATRPMSSSAGRTSRSSNGCGRRAACLADERFDLLLATSRAASSSATSVSGSSPSRP